jgi:hypothetical protein
MLRIPTFFCPKPWENMTGGETSRFCTYCEKHVHNLDALSVSDRLALLSSPAASICSRYQIAIRRPTKGREESYMRHLLKVGAGVAVTGSVLLVLWEMHEQNERAEHFRYYRAGEARAGSGGEMPDELYQELRVTSMGKIGIAPRPVVECKLDGAENDRPRQIVIKLDPVEIDKLLEQYKPTAPAHVKLKL